MTFYEYLKGVTVTWRVVVFMVGFCLWPSGAFLIFHFKEELFVSLDMGKLGLLCSAVTAPPLVLNGFLVFLIMFPSRANLQMGIPLKNLFPLIVLAGTCLTLIVYAILCFLSLFGGSFEAIKITFIAIEVLFTVISTYIRIKERP